MIYTAKEFMQSLNEDIDVFVIDSCLSTDHVKRIVGSISALLDILSTESPDAKYNYSFTPATKPTSLLVDVLTDEGDWIETNSERIISCLKYVDEFKITLMEVEQIKMSFKFLFNTEE